MSRNREYTCVCPVKLFHNLIETEKQNYGSKTLLGRSNIESTAKASIKDMRRNNGDLDIGLFTIVETLQI